MANIKETKVMKLGRVAEYLTNAGEIELAEIVNHEIEILNNKSQNKKLTPTQLENEKYKKEIIDILAIADIALTISEMQEKSEILKVLKNQKISALLKQLVDSGKVKRIVEKKTTKFQFIAE